MDKARDASMDLVKLITEYLSKGGLFNPELMEHEKVRDLLMDCRDEIEKLCKKVASLEAQLAEASWNAEVDRYYYESMPKESW